MLKRGPTLQTSSDSKLTENLAKRGVFLAAPNLSRKEPLEPLNVSGDFSWGAEGPWSSSGPELLPPPSTSSCSLI